MALKILCRVKKLTTHQGRDKKGVDCQCYHLSLKRSTNRNWFWKIERPGCRPEVLKSSHSREGLHIRIWTCWSRWWWSGKRTGHWSDLPSLLGSPLLPPTQGTSSTLGAKEATFRWVKKRSWEFSVLKLTWMHFSSRPSMIFLSFSVMMPASSMWPSVGNRFFT